MKARNSLPRLGAPITNMLAITAALMPPPRTPEPFISKRAKANAKAKAKHKRGGSLGHPEKKP